MPMPLRKSASSTKEFLEINQHLLQMSTAAMMSGSTRLPGLLAQYRKTPLISTYVISGLAMVQVLIFGAELTFGGYDKAEAKSPAKKKSVQSCVFRRQCAVVHVSAIVDILPGYRGTYIRGVCTFGALRPTANFCKK